MEILYDHILAVVANLRKKAIKDHFAIHKLSFIYKILMIKSCSDHRMIMTIQKIKCAYNQHTLTDPS